jgi:hypothetical protein
MRLAGYDLPGTPYKRVNRSYSGKKNKSSKVRTTKVVYSMTVKGRKVSDAQRKAIWAKIGAKSPVYHLIKGSDQDCDTWKNQTSLTPDGLVDRYELNKDNVEIYCKKEGIPIPPEGSNDFKRLMLSTDQISIYRANDPTTLKNRVAEWQKKGLTRSQANEKVTLEMMKEVQKNIDSGIYVKIKKVSEMTDEQLKGMHDANRQSQIDRFTEFLKRDPRLDSPIIIQVRGKWHNTTMAKMEDKLAELHQDKADKIIVGKPGMKSHEFDSLRKMIDQHNIPKNTVILPGPENQTTKLSYPEFKRLQQQQKRREKEHNAEIWRKQNERKKIHKEKQHIPSSKVHVPSAPAIKKPIIYTPIEQPTESPAARAKRLAREAAAKEESKKASKELRYSKKTFHTRSAVRKKHKASSAYSDWGDLIESQPKPKRKPRKAKKTHRASSAATSRKKKNIFDTMGKDISKGLSNITSRSKKKGKKKKGFFEYIVEEKEQADRYKREHKDEIAAKQAERRQAIEETKQELKMKGEKVKTDVSKAVKKFENPNVVGPGYDRWGHPIKGYKVKTKKPEDKEDEEQSL